MKGCFGIRPVLAGISDIASRVLAAEVEVLRVKAVPLFDYLNRVGHRYHYYYYYLYFRRVINPFRKRIESIFSVLVLSVWCPAGQNRYCKP